MTTRALEMEAASFSETSVDIYQSTRRINPEYFNLRQHCCENLRKLLLKTFFLILSTFLMQ
jgi:hypothetical protein